MNETKEIASIDDIKKLVDTFYDKVRKDELLGPIFEERIGDHWPQHLEKLYAFWQTVLLGEHTYFGTPFPPHANLPVSGKHFQQWMKLFKETLDENFHGENAKEAKFRAAKMAEMFESKIFYYQHRGNSGLV
ncbi:MAG: group III truncated hemoglobin [Bacteroidota bacterium]|nr:group III truncated hemoglobin [Bacteroidota bacterium]